jgi:hypothetical protein
MGSATKMFFIHPAPDSGSDIVPILVESTDKHGNPIPRDWFDLGVIPAAPTLRKMAAFHLGDVWRVSELAEPVVHQLAHAHGSNLGARPHRQVIRAAQWEVLTLKAGSLRMRRHPEPPLDEAEVRMNALAIREAREHEEQLLAKLRLDEIERSLSRDRAFQDAFDLRRQGWNWKEIQNHFKQTDAELVAFKKAFERELRFAYDRTSGNRRRAREGTDRRCH